MRKSLLIIFIAIAVTTFLAVHNTDSAETGGQTYHVDRNVLNEIEGIFPNLKVLGSQINLLFGLVEVTYESKGQKGIIYVDSSGKYLVLGSIVDIKTKANLTQERISELNKVDISTIPLDDALVMGDKDAKYRVIVLDDPD